MSRRNGTSSGNRSHRSVATAVTIGGGGWMALKLLQTALTAVLAQSSSSSSSSGGSWSGSNQTSSSSSGGDGGAFERDASIHVMYRGEFILASYLVAVLGSGTSLQVMKLRTGLWGTRNLMLLLGGSVALGAIGIWCMHFVGMMSIHLSDASGEQLRMGFEPSMTVASLLIGTGIIAVGFGLAGDPKHAQVWRTCLVGCVGGIGVSAMHYTGMMAMVCQAKITWDAGIIVASVGVGMFAATAALLIFFHLHVYWQSDKRLQFVIALIMGVAVNGMHYTGMQAASWTNSFEAPDFAGYASESALTGAVIALAVITCSTMLAVLLYRYLVLHGIESKKTQCLTLAVLVRNSQGKVLCTLMNTLPSLVIESAYTGNDAFTQLSPDFLRMLKISFSWSNASRYQRHLAKLNASGSIPSYSVHIFNQFVLAAQGLAALLEIPLEQLGFLHYAPTGNMITLVMRASPAQAALLEQSDSGLRFLPPAQLVSSLAELQLPKEVDPLEWVADLIDYQRRVRMASTGADGGKRDELLNDLLREVATELLQEKEQVEDEIRAWRTILGKFVNTKHHLTLLANNPAQWRQVGLEPMVKVQLEVQLLGEANAAAGGVDANGNPVSNSRNNGNAVVPRTPSHRGVLARASSEGGSAVAAAAAAGAGGVPATLYLGLLYVQVSATGMRVLLPRRGPLSMIPMVKMSQQHAIGTRELHMVQEYAARNLARGSRNGAGAPQQSPPPSMPKPKAIMAPRTTFQNAAVAVVNTGGSVQLTAIPPGSHSEQQQQQQQQLQPQQQQPQSSHHSRANSHGTIPASFAVVGSGSLTTAGPIPPATASSTVGGGGGGGGGVASSTATAPGGGGGAANGESKQPNNNNVALVRKAGGGFRLGALSQPPPPLFTESFQVFNKDLMRCVEELGKLVGSKVDLGLEHLWTDQIVVLSPEVHVICFAHCSMSRAFPPHYNPADCAFIPFPVFEIIHFAQHPSRASAGWTRKVLAATQAHEKHVAQAGKDALLAGGGSAGAAAAVAAALAAQALADAAIAGDDMHLYSTFDSKSHGASQRNPSPDPEASEDDEAGVGAGELQEDQAQHLNGNGGGGGGGSPEQDQHYIVGTRAKSYFHGSGLQEASGGGADPDEPSHSARPIGPPLVHHHYANHAHQIQPATQQPTATAAAMLNVVAAATAAAAAAASAGTGGGTGAGASAGAGGGYHGSMLTSATGVVPLFGSVPGTPDEGSPTSTRAGSVATGANDALALQQYQQHHHHRTHSADPHKAAAAAGSPSGLQRASSLERRQPSAAAGGAPAGQARSSAAVPAGSPTAKQSPAPKHPGPVPVRITHHGESASSATTANSSSNNPRAFSFATAAATATTAAGAAAPTDAPPAAVGGTWAIDMDTSNNNNNKKGAATATVAPAPMDSFSPMAPASPSHSAEVAAVNMPLLAAERISQAARPSSRSVVHHEGGGDAST